ncbi:MAG TPA: histidine kinase N-terminal 7TM domain-containing protein [bacterium]|nr:histidine kinase N-terminal 7TM domain-containing protein [bacterium]
MHLFTDIVLGVAAIAHIILGLFIFLKSRKNLTLLSFSLLLWCIAIWVVANIFIDRSSSISEAVNYAKLSALASSFMPAFFLYFAYRFQKGKPVPEILLIFIPSAIFFISSFSSAIVTNADISTFPVVISHGYLFSLFSFYIIGYFISGFILLARKLKNKTGLIRTQLAYVFIGSLSMIAVALLTNVLLPIFNISQELTRIGPASSIFFALFTSYALIKFRLFNIQIQIQKTVNAVIPIIISTVLTVFVAYVLYGYIHWSGQQNGILLLIFYTISYKFFNYFFTKTKLSYLFFRRTYHFHQSLIEFSNHASDITNFDELIKQMQKVFLGNGFIEAFAFFIITDQEKKACHILETHNFDPKEISICAESVLHPSLCQELSLQKEPLVIEELAYSNNPEHHALQEAFQPLQGGVCIPLFVSNDLAGIILLGAKTHGRAYTTEDIEIFQKTSVPLAVAVTKAALFAHLNERVTRLDQENNNLETANHELQEMKSEFLTIVNHQLNTPLSVMRSVMSMIEDGDVPLENVQSYVKQISPKMEAFSHIIQDMLSAAEFEGTGASLQFKTVNVDDILKKTINGFQELSKQNSVLIQLHLRKELPRVLTDQEKFSMALNQLIRNAIIYGREKPVVITTKQEQDHVMISIQDNGRGFDKVEAEKIGTKFFRGKQVADYLADGSGLGVYTAKKIIEASGGALMWESKGLQKGSTFTISLPKAMDFVKAIAIKQ